MVRVWFVPLALVACGEGKDPSSGSDTGQPEIRQGDDSAEETGGGETDGTDTGADETGDETGGEETGGAETGGGEETGGEETGGEETAALGDYPESSRCIEDTDELGFCEHGVYADDWDGAVRYEWAPTGSGASSAIWAVEGDDRTLISGVSTGSYWHVPGGLTVMPDGDLVLAGITLPYATLTVGDTTVSLGSDYVRFLARVSPEGELRWVTTFIGMSSESVSVVARRDGTALVSGFLWESTEFGDTTLSTTMFFDLTFVAALDEDGEWLWATAPTIPSGSYPRVYFEDLRMTGDDEAEVDIRYTSSISTTAGTATCSGSTAGCAATATVSADGEWLSLEDR